MIDCSQCDGMSHSTQKKIYLKFCTFIQNRYFVIVNIQILQFFQQCYLVWQLSQMILGHIQMLQVLQKYNFVGNFLQQISAELNKFQMDKFKQPCWHFGYEIFFQINLL